MLEGLKIVVFAVVSAVTYGILHDMVTANLCVEYFTIGHHPFVDTRNPFLLALVWGVVATWWVGVSLGIPLAIASRIGGRPKLTWRDLRRPMAVMLAGSALCAFVAGAMGYVMGVTGRLELPNHPQLQGSIGIWFEADRWAHTTSYLVGALGGVVVILYSWRMRYVRWRQLGAA